MSVRSRARKVCQRAAAIATTRLADRGEAELERGPVRDRAELDAIAVLWARAHPGRSVCVVARPCEGGLEAMLVTRKLARLAGIILDESDFARSAPAGSILVFLGRDDGSHEVYTVEVD
jgi:hypothetical protein